MPRSAERPRTVFLQACSTLAERLRRHGFRPGASGQRLKRRRGPRSDVISFGSSHHNEAGIYVAIWPSALAFDQRLRAWRRDQGSPFRSDSMVAAAQLGNLPGIGWREWNLADPDLRADQVDEIARLLETVALPWFATFDDEAKLVETLRKGGVEGMGWNCAGPAEYLLFLGRPDLAAEVVQRATSSHASLPPGLYDALEPLVRRFELPVTLPPSQEDEIARGAARLLAAVEKHARPET